MWKDKRLIFFFIFILIIILFLIGIFFPIIASSSWGRDRIAGMIARKTSGQVTIGSLKLTWFGPQTIKDFDLQSEELDLQFSNFKGDWPLWTFFSLTPEKVLKVDGDIDLKNAHAKIRTPDYPSLQFSNVDANLEIKKKLFSLIYQET